MRPGIFPAAPRRAAALALCLGWAVAAGCAPRQRTEGAAPAGSLVVAPAPIGGGERYLGSASCRECHPEAWARWRSTAHAASLGSLLPADREDPVCLRCHATGYGDPRGFRDAAATPELAAVGCEACHGPGAGHARSRYPGRILPGAGSDCPPCEVNRVCRACHTTERSPAFDLGRDLPRIACGGGRRLPVAR
jgi:hypothetical protein